jgi:beta-lactamase superfamily II metal-dependent hydrolase
MKVHFLDVGAEQYGDCILVQHGARRILIDGAHKGDIERRGTTPSIPDQLTQLMGAAPFEPDLLVITHVHGDHIGCLPELVAQGLLKPKLVLAADERWGSGIVEDGDADPLGGADRTTRLLAEAMLEEGSDVASIEDAQAFLDRYVSPEERYTTMLRSFDANIVLRYGRDDFAALEDEFDNFGLKILGPTVEHLKICAKFIAREKERAARRVRDLMATDAPADLATLFFRAVQQRRSAADPEEDRQGQGSAKNDQSIVLSVGKAAKKTLLAGDMQFAKAEVPGLRDEMATLLGVVVAHGPYAVVKLTHHASYNGMDADELDALAGDPLLVHTGGLKDPSHPEEAILEMLEARLAGERFVRTDHNGLISINLSGAQRATTFARGRWNDFEPNPKPPRRGRDEGVPLERAVRMEAAPADQRFVEVVARIPHVATSVTITVDVRPGRGATEAPGAGDRERTPVRGAEPQPSSGGIAPGRTLPQLLVLTNEEALGRRIGREEAGRAIRLLEGAGQTVIKDMPAGIPEVEPALARARTALQGGDYSGVLLLGGYDVVPSVRLSVVDDSLREQIDADLDDYIVWSDDAYAAMDDDNVPDLPVSRIPDGGDARLVFACLEAEGATTAALGAFGLRNKARPFADRIYQQLAQSACLQSAPSLAGEIASEVLRARHLYFMLHGHYIDGDEYTGEDGDDGYPVAFTAARVPEKLAGVIFAGCCYGALLTRFPAVDTRPDRTPPARAIEESVALTFLRAGAQAFVGCTGVHYSPPPDSPDTNGEPMHEAFWRHFLAGKTPAEALFEAKREYLPRIPHSGVDDAYAEAIELKIYSQFTCLGLGW